MICRLFLSGHFLGIWPVTGYSACRIGIRLCLFNKFLFYFRTTGIFCSCSVPFISTHRKEEPLLNCCWHAFYLIKKKCHTFFGNLCTYQEWWDRIWIIFTLFGDVDPDPNYRRPPGSAWRMRIRIQEVKTAENKNCNSRFIYF